MVGCWQDLRDLFNIPEVSLCLFPPCCSGTASGETETVVPSGRQREQCKTISITSSERSRLAEVRREEMSKRA